MELSPFAARAQQSLFPFEVLRELQQEKKNPTEVQESLPVDHYLVCLEILQGGMQGRAGCGARWACMWAEHL